MKVEIIFPQEVYISKDVEMSEEDFFNYFEGTLSEKADILEKYMSQTERQQVRGTLEGAIDYGYASIKKQS